MRSHVLTQAAAATAAADRPRALAPLPPEPRFALAHLRLAPRAFALGMALTLTFGTGAAVLAAPPGSPFYHARLVVESALLPAQLNARLAGYERHLADRLREAEAAAASGDANALAAALAAYRAALDAALEAFVADGGRLAHLEAAIEKHLAKLHQLATRLPAEAVRGGAVHHAIHVSQRAVDEIKSTTRKGGNGRNAAGGGTRGSGNDNPNGNSRLTPAPELPGPRGNPNDREQRRDRP